MLIHKEGRKTLFVTTIILVLLNGLTFNFFPESLFSFILLSVSVVFFILVMNFFKKPSRVYEGDLLDYVNAPTDGKVVAIEKVFENTYFNEERIQISIFMSFFKPTCLSRATRTNGATSSSRRPTGNRCLRGRLPEQWRAG